MRIRPYIIHICGGKNTNRDRLLSLCKFFSEKCGNVRILVSNATAKELIVDINEQNCNIIIDRLHISIKKPQSYQKIIIYILAMAFLGCIRKIPKDINLIYSMTGIITDVLPGFVLKLRKSRLKWVVLIDNLVPSPSRGNGIYFFDLLAYLGFRMSVFLSKSADIVFQNNSIVKKGLLDLGISEKKIMHTANGIVYDDIGKAEESLVKKYDAVFLGRLNYTKGLFDLVDIWKKIVNIKSCAKMALIGDGEKITVMKLKNKIKKNKLENNIVFLGFLTKKEKFTALKEGKIFVFPSKSESWGIAIMEALACGLPVIVYNLPFYKEIYNDILYEVELNNVEEFAKKLIKLLENPSILNKNIIEGKKISNNYSWEKVIKNEFEYIAGLY